MIAARRSVRTGPSSDTPLGDLVRVAILNPLVRPAPLWHAQGRARSRSGASCTWCGPSWGSTAPAARASGGARAAPLPAASSPCPTSTSALGAGSFGDIRGGHALLTPEGRSQLVARSVRRRVDQNGRNWSRSAPIWTTRQCHQHHWMCWGARLAWAGLACDRVTWCQRHRALCGRSRPMFGRRSVPPAQLHAAGPSLEIGLGTAR